MGSDSALFDSLQREFCPPLDSSLLAALLAEIESDGGGNVSTPSSRQIHELRTTLLELSAQADESQLSEFVDLQRTSLTDETSSTPDLYQGNTATSGPSCTESSGSSQHSFSSPIGFLQAALPHIQTERLRTALENAEAEGDDLDMWDIVAGILTDESVRELEERGLDALDDVDVLGHISRDEVVAWEVVGARKKKPPRERPMGKRKNKRSHKITLVDVRQQQHVRPLAIKGSSPEIPPAAPAPDPWTQLSSLSSYAATLLPPHPASFFQSYFHSPDCATPYHALCSALQSICDSRSMPADDHTGTLFTLLDILLPEYEHLDSEQRSRLISNIELSLRAAGGRGDDALDLVKLLQDLNSDSSGNLEMGIYHLNPQSPVETRTTKRPTLTTGPPPISMTKPKPPSQLTKVPSSFAWQSVPLRKIPRHGPHPLAVHIPAYANGAKVKGTSKGDTAEFRRRMGDNMRRRNELLREATRMWQRGNSKTRGGEIALHLADRARRFQELARKETLDAARTMVESKRLASGDSDAVDLHGTTVVEAIIITKEILQRQGSSPGKPLKIITGRGSHSMNQVGVLKPAIRNALVKEGWSVGTWDGGLVVRGKCTG